MKNASHFKRGVIELNIFRVLYQAEPPVATLKKKKSRLPTSISYGGPGGRVDDERAELDDFGGVDQWERDERIGGVSSRASHLSAINSVCVVLYQLIHLETHTSAATVERFRFRLSRRRFSSISKINVKFINGKFFTTDTSTLCL